VHLESGTGRARDQGDRRVLHDDRVDACGGHASDQRLDDRQLGLEHERVQRDVEAGASAVNPRDDLREGVGGEVDRAGPGVEAVVEAEIDRVGTGSEGGGEGVAVTGGGEDLGAAHRESSRTRGESGAGSEGNLRGQRSIPRSGWETIPSSRTWLREWGAKGLALRIRDSL
jgi:hypothetical protein